MHVSNPLVCPAALDEGARTLHIGRFVAAALLLLAAGCQSRFVAATIANDTEQPLHVVELDYPGASFGVSMLAPHAVYSYRFKAIGSGPLALSYTDTSGASHTSTGPVLNDGQGGSLAVHIGGRGAVHWEPVFASH